MYEAVNAFRAKLAAGQTCFGAGITLSDSSIVEAIAPAVDFVWIDMEHSHLDLQTVHAHLIAARAGGVAGLVRVRSSDIAQLKPVLDIGAEGVIVPQVRSAAEVAAVVAATRYAPLGRRGYGPRRAGDYGRVGGGAAMRRGNESVFVAVQIENREALAELDEIAVLEGVDSLALGPADLAIELGCGDDWNHPDVIAAIERIIAAARRAGKFIGTGLGPDPDAAAAAVKRGVQWLQCGDDYGYMVAVADSLFAQMRRNAVGNA